jgi:acetyltransferase-like isoleucine patch superfamily enzyme
MPAPLSPGPLTAHPQEITFGPKADGVDKLRALVGHCDLRVFFTDDGYVDVGRGSFTALLRVDYFDSKASGCLGRVGQFCNFADGSMLFAGGEHRNDQPVNVVFNSTPVLGKYARGVPTLWPKAAEPFDVGDAVVVSAQAKVLAGARVGTGGVLAADCLVTSDMPAFNICAGIPAKAIRARVDAGAQVALLQVRWWDFDIVYLASNMARLQELAVDVGAPHEYRKPAPRFALRVRKQGAELQFEILGFTEGARVRPMKDAPVKARRYIEQLVGAGPFHWVADPWN